MDMEEEVDDPMEIDDTIHTSLIIENKSLTEASNTETTSLENAAPEAVDTTGDIEAEITPTESEATKKQAEIVILDDDEEEQAAAAVPDKTEESASEPEVETIIDLVPDSIGGVCINYSCKSGKSLIIAPNFCISYFRVNGGTNNKIKKVCQECYDIAINMFDKLVGEFKAGNLLTVADIPLRNDMVEIEDSDDEEEEEKIVEEYLDEGNLEFVKENIDHLIEETLFKFNFKAHVSKEVQALNKRLQVTKELTDELADNLKQLRKTTDGIQLSFYNEFRPRYQERLAFHIVDDRTVSSNILYKREVSSTTAPQPSISPSKVINPLPPSAPTTPSRKSNRNIGKHISYAEMDDQANSNSPKPVTDLEKQLQTVEIQSDEQGPAEEPDVIEDDEEGNKENVGGDKSFEEPVMEAPADLPPKQAVVREKSLTIDEIYYISRENSGPGNWMRARLNLIIPPFTPYNNQRCGSTLYKFTELKQQKERILAGKNVAYLNPATTCLNVGERVIAVLKLTSAGEIKKTRTNPYYPGVVGEPPYAQNKYRYLVFFDIGYAQYVHYNSVNLIHEVSAHVWEDMPLDSRPFIKKHIESQDWPMVKLKKDERIICEYNGKWLLCLVISVDCSLVHVFFEDLNRFEWIYRGSRRIKEIYREEKATNRPGAQRVTRKVGQNDAKPKVQYTPNVNYVGKDQIVVNDDEVPANATANANTRAVARKSTTSRPTRPVPTSAPQPFLPSAQSTVQPAPGPTSKIMYFTPRDQHTMRRPYRRHTCSPKCKDFLTHNITKLRGQNPLSKPLLCGWARMTVKVRGRKDIIYKAPCGRLLRDISEVHYYLFETKSDMTIDWFDFNHSVRCLAEFSVDCEPDPKDLSKGLEQVPIPVINDVNNDLLDFCNYQTKRVPMEGVNMNLDPDFLACCDCEDNCIDKSSCACWNLTLEGARYFEKNIDPDTVGYIYRRLQEQVVTGIYECNSRCKCQSTCLNRVAQIPLSLKLQVFRTHNRGWGIRCLNDVPQGTFICVYAGTMHTDQHANIDGKEYGDEYFAELDYIESVEKYKHDYESEAPLTDEDRLALDRPPRQVTPDPEPEAEPDTTSRRGRGRGYSEDNDFVTYASVKDLDRQSRAQTRRRTRPDSTTTNEEKIQIKQEMSMSKQISNLGDDIDTVTISDDEDEVREVLSFNPKSSKDLDDEERLPGSVRSLYGSDENIYIMDAKNAGNIGRFLNHSCSPNVFVQNVFVDTHDPRFPWVAFFSSQYLRAGTELTWNYSYDVGSVPGKVLYCHCASLECKGRLL